MEKVMVQDTAAAARRGDAPETASVIVSALSAWAPGVTTMEEWREWAALKRQIKQSTDAPDLKGFTTSLFRRRLSQVTRMTIQVVHDTVEKIGLDEQPMVECFSRSEKCIETTTMPMVFASCRGELAREFAVSRMLVSDHEVLPASFSLSVFNTPIALTAIALGLHGGYTAVYPVGGNFRSAFLAAAAQVMSGGCRRVLAAYADEMVPAEYGALPDAVGQDGKPYAPMAFAFVISAAGEGAGRPGPAANGGAAVRPCDVPTSSAEFLRYLFSCINDMKLSRLKKLSKTKNGVGA